jgi:hypothetical protein
MCAQHRNVCFKECYTILKLKSNTGSYPIRIVAHVSVLEAEVCQMLITHVAVQPANDIISLACSAKKEANQP